MSFNRRKFIVTSTLGSLSFAKTSSFFFPKPANAYSLNYRLSQDGRADAVFRTFREVNIAQGETANLPPETNSVVAEVVQSVQQEFTNRSYTDSATPFSKRLGNVDNPLWGRQRNERLGPNPGFGTIQVVNNFVSPIAFTGSTTAGVDRGMQVLGGDEHLDALELDGALVPTRNRFEDWGTWDGDVDPNTGEYLGPSSITSYETRFGSVTRLYTVKEPGPGGFAEILFIIDGGRRVKANLNIRVDFS
ncbi:hypothetical protein SPB21_33345 [Leptothoe sp. ISB3NOV94-8A]|uniref:hypothetical protein n=1 Tax=Adonisia turfae TaxID=2950184 RepID=UPI002029AE89|nr:hypothetical protein [Adonisia turfae]MDV3348347.1 hypothetical protein [Leptothoe sp. LEGE 181152]